MFHIMQKRLPQLQVFQQHFRIELVSLQIADMLSSRGSHACAVLDDKLYAIGGWAALKPLVRPKFVFASA